MNGDNGKCLKGGGRDDGEEGWGVMMEGRDYGGEGGREVGERGDGEK